MKKILYIFSSVLFFLSFTGCNGCSNKSDTSWADGGDYEYYEEEDLNYGQEASNGNTITYPVEVEIPAGQSLQEAGRSVYTDLLDWEELYNFGGVKLCAEMSADRTGKWYSSFNQNTTIDFCPPSDLHLHKIAVTDSSSNIICRIINGEVEATVGNVQNDIFHIQEQSAFIVDIAVSNLTAENIPVVIPLGQMLEVQAPNVQNIVICNTYYTVLEPYQSQTFSVKAYCGAEKRQDPTYKSAKLTPFVLTAPTDAYNSQQSLWNFQRTRPVNDKYYTITFYAWGSGSDNCNGEKSDFGHAFVDIPEIGVVGYGGTVFDHTNKVQCAKYQVSVKVNESALRKAQNKYWEWKNNPPEYELMRNDCTTFTMDIADAAGIYYGYRWLIQSPAGFLRELRTYNERL